MRYPTLPIHSRRRVSVPVLSGGVNANDNPSLIGDNQLTACNNMYFRMGRLRARPAARHISGHSAANHDLFYKNGDAAYIFSPDGHICEMRDSDSGITVTSTGALSALAHSEAIAAPVSAAQVGSHRASGIMIRKSGNDVSAYTIFGENGVLSATLENFYNPTVLINSNGGDNPYVSTVNGMMLEGYNLLTDGFIMYGTCSDRARCWRLPRLMKGGEYIEVSLIDPIYGEIFHRIRLPATLDRSDSGIFTRYQSETPHQASYYDRTSGTTVTYQQVIAYDARDNCIAFLSKRTGETVFGLNIPPSSVMTYKNGSSNIRFYIEKRSGSSADMITGMKCARWFGGSRGGFGGGTRLFVAGNDNCTGAIYWSDLNRPTYFSENNYAYVGDSSEITALAQQDNLLVIFQPHAITVSEYVEGQSLSAEGVIEGSVLDTTTLSAVFPLTPVHSGIGCDCPDTVQLCSNQLVWLTSDGKVYTLVSHSQYNEHNVSEVSYAIEPLLKAHTREELRSAKSVDADGKYCLFIGSKVYVLDYADSHFAAATSAEVDMHSHRGLKWYVWTLPEFIDGVERVFCFGQKIVLVSAEDIYSIDMSGTGTEDHDGTEYHPISCSFTTKLFRFGIPERYKRIDSVSLGIADIVGTVRIDAVVNGRHKECERLEIPGDTDSIGYHTVYPDARESVDFGVSVSSDSAMELESMTIIYQETGEIR